jgi:hypothetical protein
MADLAKRVRANCQRMCGTKMPPLVQQKGKKIQTFDPDTGVTKTVGTVPTLPNGQTWQLFTKVKAKLLHGIRGEEHIRKGDECWAVLMPHSIYLEYLSGNTCFLVDAKRGKDFEFIDPLIIKKFG